MKRWNEFAPLAVFIVISAASLTASAFVQSSICAWCSGTLTAWLMADYLILSRRN